MTTEEKLRAAGITPTIEACTAYQLGYKAGARRSVLTAVKWGKK